MPFLGSIAHNDKVPHVLGKFSDQGSTAGRPLVDFHQELLRGESPFTVQQRELMAAFVSGVNACVYCHGAHSAVAELFGVPAAVITGLVADVDSADVDESMKPVFRYLLKLTQTPTRIVQADVDAILAAGWSERAVYDAVLVGCLYNFMNRFTDGLGLTPIPEDFPMEGKMIAEGGYNAMLDAFGIR